MWILSSLAFYFAYIFVRVMSFSFDILYFIFHDFLASAIKVVSPLTVT